MAALIASLVLANATTGPASNFETTLSTSASKSSAGIDRADQPPGQCLGGRQPLGQQRHPHRADPADRGGDQRRRAAVGHQPDLGEGEHEKCLLGSQYEVACQGQGHTDAGRRPVHDGDDRTRQRGDGPHRRLISAMIPVRRPPPRSTSSALMPAPELKPRPAPPRRTTLTRGSVAACSIASAIPASTGVVSELRLSGRSMVTDSTPSDSVTSRPATGASVAIRGIRHGPTLGDRGARPRGRLRRCERDGGDGVRADERSVDHGGTAERIACCRTGRHRARPARRDDPRGSGRRRGAHRPAVGAPRAADASKTR